MFSAFAVFETTEEKLPINTYKGLHEIAGVRFNFSFQEKIKKQPLEQTNAAHFEFHIYPYL
jgi:hypothetical protein